MPAWLTALFNAITALAGFGTKAITPDEIRIDNHERAKPRLTANEKIRIYDRAYIRLKDHPEIDLQTDIQYNYDSLNIEDQQELFKLLNARIIEYRLKHKLLFRKWLKTQKLI